MCYLWFILKNPCKFALETEFGFLNIIYLFGAHNKE